MTGTTGTTGMTGTTGLTGTKEGQKNVEVGKCENWQKHNPKFPDHNANPSRILLRSGYGFVARVANEEGSAVRGSMQKKMGKIISDGIVTVSKEVKNGELPLRCLFLNEGSVAKLKGKNNWKMKHN